MRGDQDPVPGISSRRSACDRCRCMKLRCLREGPDKETRCDRCSRADTECVTNPIFRMRNYSVGDDATRARSRKHQRQDNHSPQYTQHKLPIADDETSTSWLLTDSASIGSFAKSRVAVSAEGAFPESRAWDPSMKSVMPILPSSNGFSAAQDLWDVDNLGSELFPFHESFDKAFTNFDVTPDGAKLSTDAQTSMSVALQPLLLADTPSQNPSSHSTTSITQGSERQAEDVARLNSHSDFDAPDSVSHFRHVNNEICIQRLSQINLDLVRQLDRFDEAPHTVTLGMLIPPIGKSPSSAVTPVDKLLNSINQFLDMLGLLTALSQPSAVSLSARGLGPKSRVSRARQESDNCTSDLPFRDSSFPLSPRDDESPISPPKSKSTEVPKIELPSATLLLILTCYLHILRFYVNLFARIQEFLQRVSDSDDRCLSPIPGLGFNNLPIQSGNLQATMFIQVVTNMLERIESLLGLPREFRINNRGDSSDGLLRGQDFFEIAESVLRKEELGLSENNNGGIKSLRSYMRKAKQLLRESIAP